MKKNLIQFVTLISFFTFFVSVTSAASPQDVEKVIHALNHKSNKLGMFGGDKESFTVTYTANGNSYLASYDAISGPKLTFTKYPRKGSRAFKYFIDENLDGKVDYGAQGYYAKTGEVSRTYRNSRVFNSMNKEVLGEQNHKYWQRIYDSAIADALKHFKN